MIWRSPPSYKNSIVDHVTIVLRRVWASTAAAAEPAYNPLKKNKENPMFPVKPLCAGLLLCVAATPFSALAASTYTATLLPENMLLYGINNAGQGVGDFSIPEGSTVAISWSGGQMTHLPTLGGMFSNGTANAINNHGEITGSSAAPHGSYAFIFAEGKMQNLGSLGGDYSAGAAINGPGQVAGVSSLSNGQQHAFMYSDGHMSDLGTLGGDTSFATGINHGATVVGTSWLTSDQNVYHAFTYGKGIMSDLGTLGGQTSWASAINDAGQIVGHSDVAGDGGVHAFLFENGVMHDIGSSFSDRNTKALGINGAGAVVGELDDPLGQNHGFLYENGKLTDLNDMATLPAGWTINWAAGINDAGQIIGGACTESFQCSAVLLNPIAAVPEPQTYAMLLLGIALVGQFRKRQGRTVTQG